MTLIPEYLFERVYDSMGNIIGVKNPKIVNHFMKNYIFPPVGRPIDEERKLREWIDEEVPHSVSSNHRG